MSTLDQIRANLKAGKPHVVTSVATPRATSTSASSKSDPLAAVRAKLKGGKTTASAGLLPNESSGSLRLARLEAAVNAIALTFSGTQLSSLKSAVAAVK
jgi:hypothetical protein